MAELWNTDVCVELMKAATYGRINESEIISLASKAYATTVSTGTMKNCLGILVKIGFIKYDEAEREYRATERGKKFVEVFDEIWLAGDTVEEQSRMIPYYKRNYL
jgi:predicted transcriptional regulator